MAKSRYAAAGSALLAATLAGSGAALVGCGQTAAEPAADSPSSVIATATPTPTPTSRTVGRPASTGSAISTPSAHPSPTLPPGATVRILRVRQSAYSSGVELYPVGSHEPHVVAPGGVYVTMGTADPELRSHPSTIELATYRSDLNGGRIYPGNGSSRVVRSMLVWVIIYHGITPVWPDTGPGPYNPSPSAKPKPKPVPTDCQWVYLANAVTGQYQGAFGSCPGELTHTERR